MSIFFVSAQLFPDNFIPNRSIDPPNNAHSEGPLDTISNALGKNFEYIKNFFDSQKSPLPISLPQAPIIAPLKPKLNPNPLPPVSDCPPTHSLSIEHKQQLILIFTQAPPYNFESNLSALVKKILKNNVFCSYTTFQEYQIDELAQTIFEEEIKLQPQQQNDFIEKLKDQFYKDSLLDHYQFIIDFLEERTAKMDILDKALKTADTIKIQPHKPT